MGEADAGSTEAGEVLRILTPLVKFRACRDNVTVATGAMEVRGGNGYIEEWVNARLIRDAQVGLLWEGTSNINALDVIGRAVGKTRAHKPLEALLRGRLKEIAGLPAVFTGRLESALTRALDFAERVAREPASEPQARRASSAPLSCRQRRAARLGRYARPGRRPSRAAGPLRAGASAGPQGPARARGGGLGRARHRGVARGCSRPAYARRRFACDLRHRGTLPMLGMQKARNP